MSAWVLDKEAEISEHTGIQAPCLGDPSNMQLTWCSVGKIAESGTYCLNVIGE